MVQSRQTPRPQPESSRTHCHVALVDLFGYLGILLHGLVIVSQSMALGGMLFLIFLARPFAAASRGRISRARTARIAAISALCLVGGGSA